MRSRLDGFPGVHNLNLSELKLAFQNVEVEVEIAQVEEIRETIIGVDTDSQSSSTGWVFSTTSSASRQFYGQSYGSESILLTGCGGTDCRMLKVTTTSARAAAIARDRIDFHGYQRAL